MPDREQLQTFVVEGADGQDRQVLLVHPGGRRPAPVVLSPHPMGFTAISNVFGEPRGPRTIVDVPGIWPTARDRGVAVICVEGRGAGEPGATLGNPAHLDAFVEGLHRGSELVPLDLDRVVAAGLSQGGLESLLLAARHPQLVRAVAGQNSLTDPATWFPFALSMPDLAEHAQAFRAELGGTPDSAAETYAERSPLALAADLAGHPIMLRYSRFDRIVPADTQSVALAAALRRIGGQPLLVEDDEGGPHAGGRAAHEHVDWPSLVDFCLDVVG